jgi:hypothetical protein
LLPQLASTIKLKKAKKFVKKLSKNCQKIVKKLSKSCQKKVQSYQKFVKKNFGQKFVNNLLFCSGCPEKKEKKKKIGGS